MTTPFTEASQADLKALWDAGKGIDVIAMNTGRDMKTLRRWARRMGLMPLSVGVWGREHDDVLAYRLSLGDSIMDIAEFMARRPAEVREHAEGVQVKRMPAAVDEPLPPMRFTADLDLWTRWKRAVFPNGVRA